MTLHAYHLLATLMSEPPRDARASFAFAVRSIVSGLVTHDTYMQRLSRAPSASELETRARTWSSIDLNPVAELIASARDETSFERRWNGFNARAPLAVNTQLRDGKSTRESRCAERDTALRTRVIHACISNVMSREAHPEPLRAVRRQLALPSDAIGEVLALLHVTPHATLDRTAKALHSSRRTIQRALFQATLSFSELRQAIRLSLAGVRIRAAQRPLTEIALASGFSDSAHLTHAFKRSCGLTPTAYRTLWA